jgi:PIN domain nuclease of toxin-antitoxin system
MGDPSNQLWFSVVSIWEIAIKHGLGRIDFAVDPRQLRIGLQYGGYRELAVAGDHVVGAGALPAIHRDPFDRLLIMQASVEDMTLLTADRTVARYPGPIRLV